MVLKTEGLKPFNFFDPSNCMALDKLGKPTNANRPRKLYCIFECPNEEKAIQLSAALKKFGYEGGIEDPEMNTVGFALYVRYQYARNALLFTLYEAWKHSSDLVELNFDEDIFP